MTSSQMKVWCEEIRTERSEVRPGHDAVRCGIALVLTAVGHMGPRGAEEESSVEV